MIGYYKTKLKTFGLVSPHKAAELAYELFCTPRFGRHTGKMPVFFEQAEQLSFVLDGLTVRGFRFLPSSPNGKKIALAHGFSSYSYKFERYIKLLTQEGFEVLTFDAPGHGTSEGKLINAAIYRDVLLQVESLYGPLYGLIGHSLGGLSAALAFETLPDTENRKLVLIAPATETETTFADFFKFVKMDDKVKKAFTSLVVELAGAPVSYFSVSRVVKKTKGSVFWVHDKQDPICPFKDVKPLLSLDLPHVRFLVTEHLGHSKVYKDNAVSTQIVQFFNGNNT